MKAWPLVALLGAAVLAGGVMQRKSTMSASAPGREAVFAQMQRFAETQLKLTKIECGEITTVTPDTPCYVTDLSGPEVQKALAAQTQSQQVTRWRDDYGTLGAEFAWQDSPWVMGVVYTRSDLADFEGRPDIRAHKGLVHVIIDTQD